MTRAIITRTSGLGFAGLMVAVLVLFMSIPAVAQVAGGTLSGTVADTNGGPIPNAKISIKNQATGISSDITSNSVPSIRAQNST